ncbi:hypothetical protein JVT61DRAFT_7884 [Boletus reticuloceps]|uniref:Myb/SANT-like domain-containing protein n=1 Tax=Boletus reticuloceps TaxID=495285 RepID=A0A8I3A6T5_9AGAM|nr:hypothetical protein JVT61DRAFT_7884 [Boletus reticuloceps]
MSNLQADPYLRRADIRRRQLRQQLLTISTQLRAVSYTMTRPVDDDSAAQARWSLEEITALVDYLHTHRSEGNGAGGFKSATFTGAVKHLEPFHVAGSKVKDVKSVKYKWGALKAILAIINRWRNTSGNHYDDINGAKVSVAGGSAEAVFNTFAGSKASVLLIISPNQMADIY